MHTCTHTHTHHTNAHMYARMHKTHSSHTLTHTDHAQKSMDTFVPRHSTIMFHLSIRLSMHPYMYVADMYSEHFVWDRQGHTHTHTHTHTSWIAYWVKSNTRKVGLCPTTCTHVHNPQHSTKLVGLTLHINKKKCTILSCRPQCLHC